MNINKTQPVQGSTAVPANLGPLDDTAGGDAEARMKLNGQEIGRGPAAGKRFESLSGHQQYAAAS